MKIKKTNVKLGEVIKMLRKLECEAIFARQPWSADSECVLVELEERDQLPKDLIAAGFAYFMDVVTALEVLEAFGKRRPKMDEKLRLLSFYAENDAYPDWVLASEPKAAAKPTKPAKPTKAPKVAAKRSKPTKAPKVAAKRSKPTKGPKH